MLRHDALERRSARKLALAALEGSGRSTRVGRYFLILLNTRYTPPPPPVK
jgi:hypothetical protein